ncbi:protein ecdysoneless homolog [Amphiura filiformis]|uniref:protein ecdysoneless homolog n=1 Tax=Amphiura filiformis TaxID=82378 RepID=UPI003B21D60E
MVSLPHVHRDDVLEYRLFPALQEDLKDETAIVQTLEECMDIYLAHLSPFLVDYIWQSQPFSLHAVGPDTSNNLPSHLFGATHFGDNIEDEWFIVYLLHQLTAVFPGLVCSIQDNDGNFLLIEAAYHLPRWLNPDTSSNRVFIYNGDLHVIPTPTNPSELVTLPAGVPSIQQALNLVRGQDVVTLADKPIRDDIHRRINHFPGKIKDDWHYTHCYLPVKLGVVLRHKPTLIAPAVQTFYQRDPIDLKACRVMKHFLPEDMVMVQVKFTRCLYAQLSQQKFHPDQRSGWKVPAQSNPRHKACDLGMKLAHGFEILCSRCADGGSSNSESSIEGTSGVRWQRYLQSLKDKGYFRDELEGSKLYTKLLDSAKKFYQETTSNISSEGTSGIGHQVLQILQSVPCDIAAWKAAERDLPPSQDDSWLNLTPEQLDKMLEKAAGNPSKSKDKASTSGGSANDDPSMDLDAVTKGIKTFVDKVSSYEGAEFPKEFGGDDDGGAINFDVGSFEEALENILSYRRAGPDDDSDDSDSDDDDDFDFEDGDDGEPVGEDVQMLSLMEQMDRELAGTEIGKSFEKEPAETDATKSLSLSQSQPRKASSEAAGVSRGPAGAAATGDEEDEERPVEVDVNLLKNIMESYSSQQGLAGPASNILHSLGVHLPQDEDKDT